MPSPGRSPLRASGAPSRLPLVLFLCIEFIAASSAAALPAPKRQPPADSAPRSATADVRSRADGATVRLANRVGVRGDLKLTGSGRLTVAAPAAPRGDRPAIPLAAGVTLQPGASLGLQPAASRRDSDAPSPSGAGSREGYLVQFADDSPDSARARILGAGASLVAPIAGDAWLVRADAPTLARLQVQPGDPWIAEYEAAYKLSPALVDTGAGPAKVTALLFDDTDGEAALAALRSLGAQRVVLHRGRWNQLVRFELDHARLTEAASLTGVAWLEPTPRYVPNNDQAQWVVQSGVADHRPVTDRGLNGEGQIVMVCDSGLRTNHEMFDDSTVVVDGWGDYPEHRKVIAYKPGSSSPAISFGDEVTIDYHGTHTSGTVAGDPSATSSSPWGGMAKHAKLYFMDVGASGGTLELPADLNELYAPSYAGNAAGAARISSNSWGAFVQARYTISAMQTDQFVWDHPDYLIHFSAGNVGVFAAVSSPGTAKNVITVGATGNGEFQTKLAPFSSRGPVFDGRRKPNLVAPGDGVVSSVGATRYAYARYSGTSMATPAVAGAMALVRQYLTQGWYPTGAPVAANAFTPSAALLRAMAVAAARNDVAGFRAPDNVIGYGRLAIDDVLHFPGDSLRTLLTDSGDGLEHGAYVEYEFEVADSNQPVKVSLAWTDAPGNPAATVSLVNDLDLLVIHNGVAYRGNALLNNVSAPNGPRDSLNVEELVRFATPAAGRYVVRIEGKRVMQGPQNFALCITGGVGGPAGALALDHFEYGLDDTLAIEVIDSDAPDPVQAWVSSDTEGANELVTLTGSGGVYRARMPLHAGPVQLGDGRLSVSTGDVVRVRYQGRPPADPFTATAKVRLRSATITNVHAMALGGSQVLVTWDTDQATRSRVRFGRGPVLEHFVDAEGFVTNHSVLLSGLEPATTYRYDVESSTRDGYVTCDSLAGAHRSITTKPRGSLALLMDDPSSTVLATWTNAFDALGWDVDVWPRATLDPPLVGDRSTGLRSYDAVLWQVDPDRYPPFSDAQRAALDSLVEGGSRLLVTGHDIGFGLSDAGAPSYSVERELWLERTLKSRYYIDNLYADTLTGVAGSTVSGAFLQPIHYPSFRYPDSGDNVGPAPNSGGVWSPDWIENVYKTRHVGMHWESDAPLGVPGSGVWGGANTRIVGMFYEWCALESSSPPNRPRRTGVLHDAVAWLVGHRPPQAIITSPASGTTVVTDFLPVWFSLGVDAGRAVASRQLEYSLDGGEAWQPAIVAAWNDSMAVWDLASALGGTPVGNSVRARLRLRVVDDGTPALSAYAVSGTFTMSRRGGDTRAPALVAGSANCSSLPLRPGRAATLFATFSDAETGGGGVVAAEYSNGASPAPAGAGLPMSGPFGTATVLAQADLPTAAFGPGAHTLWVRARDVAGNWSEPSPLAVTASGEGVLSVEDAVRVDFLAPPSPNPFRGRAAFAFGLAQEGDVSLDLFDVAGRSIRTLAEGRHRPGRHSLVWDGRDRTGHPVPAGVYFVRLKTPTRAFHARIVSLP